MAAGSFFGNLKDKMRSVYSNFFFDEEAAPSPRMQEEAYPMDAYAAQPQAAQPAAWPQYEAPAVQTQPQAAYQPPVQPQPAAYQPPQAQPYAPQAAPAPVYQQPAAYQQPQPNAYQPRVFQNQVYSAQQPRNRRMQQRERQENNVVDFGAYQSQQPAAYQQPAPAAAPQPMEAPAAAVAAAANARIINARGMGDVRSAITLLRNGDTVLIVLENVSDPAEMRRLVDTLSGACYSLVATITKVSRYGVYLLAPQSMAVYADQTTNQMNGAPARQPVRPYQPQRAPYQQPAPAVYAAYAAPMQQGYAQRAAVPAEAAQPFYTRPAPTAAPAPDFSAQAAGNGYAPDEAAAQ